MMCGECGPVIREISTSQIAGCSLFVIYFLCDPVSLQVPRTVHSRELELLQFRTAWKERNYMGCFLVLDLVY